MNLSYEEKLNLENSKEHLQVVLGNLRIANTELSIVLNSITDAKIELSNAQSETERINRENSEALLGITLQKSELIRKEENLFKREESVTEREKTVNDDIDKANLELKNIQDLITSTKSKYVAIHTDLMLATQEKEAVLTAHTEKIHQHEETIKENNRISKESTNEIIGLNSEIKKAQKELDDFRKAAAIEIKNTNELIEVEKAKIKVPLEIIKSEQEKLDAKSNNLDILVARLREQYKLLNPDRAVPIDLQ